MIRRQTVSFPCYIIVIGFLLALAVTEPCHGHKALRVADSNSQELEGILGEETSGVFPIAHDNKAERHLEDGNEDVDGETGGDEEVEEAGEGGGGEDEQEEEAEETETGEEEVGDQEEEEEVAADEAEVEENVEDAVGNTDAEENADVEDAEELAEEDGGDANADPEQEEDNGVTGGEPETEEQEEVETPDEDGELGGTPDDAVDETTETEEADTVDVVEQQESGVKDENSEIGNEPEQVEEAGNNNSEAEETKTGSTGGSKNDEELTHWEGDYGEPAVGKYVVGFFLIIGIISYFKCCRKSGGGPMSPSSNRSHAKGKYETVATDEFDGGDGDDWGWDGDDDNAGDVELAAPTIPSPSGLSLKQRSPSVEKREVRTPSATRQKSLQLPKTQSQPSPQPMSQPPMITSLGAPKPVVKKTPRKTKDDDIFASMGLTAQPKFETTRPATKPTARTGGGWGSLAAAAPAASSIAVPTPSTSDDAGDWGGDDDLDDLFDD